jgi:RPA family protein
VPGTITVTLNTAGVADQYVRIRVASSTGTSITYNGQVDYWIYYQASS